MTFPAPGQEENATPLFSPWNPMPDSMPRAAGAALPLQLLESRKARYELLASVLYPNNGAVYDWRVRVCVQEMS